MIVFRWISITHRFKCNLCYEIKPDRLLYQQQKLICFLRQNVYDIQFSLNKQFSIFPRFFAAFFSLFFSSKINWKIRIQYMMFIINCFSIQIALYMLTLPYLYFPFSSRVFLHKAYRCYAYFMISLLTKKWIEAFLYVEHQTDDI